jgi:hypothetical protein
MTGTRCLPLHFLWNLKSVRLKLLDIMKCEILELYIMHRYGLMQLELNLQDRDIDTQIKTKNIIDKRLSIS